MEVNPVPCQDLIRTDSLALLSARDSPPSWRRHKPGSQEMMAKMNASMAAILRLAELIKLYALIGKMQLLSSPKIVEMAERIAHAIHETYRGPKKTFNDIEGFLSSDAVNPLRAFSEACRNELRTSGPLL